MTRKKLLLLTPILGVCLCAGVASLVNRSAPASPEPVAVQVTFVAIQSKGLGVPKPIWERSHTRTEGDPSCPLGTSYDNKLCVQFRTLAQQERVAVIYVRFGPRGTWLPPSNAESVLREYIPADSQLSHTYSLENIAEKTVYVFRSAWLESAVGIGELTLQYNTYDGRVFEGIVSLGDDYKEQSFAQVAEPTSTPLSPQVTASASQLPTIPAVSELPTLPPAPQPMAAAPASQPHSTPPPAITVGAGYPCLAGTANWQSARVVAVLDGDTIEVQLSDGRIERVRYIGMDTPERDEPGYAEATQANRALLGTGQVFLSQDVNDRDRFGRLLRYVVGPSGSVNHELVRQGWARTLTIPPDTRCADEFVALQREAQALGRGLWAQAQAAPPPMPTSTTQGRVGGGCHPSYPDVCIAPPPPDLRCQDIPYRRFRVLLEYGDPHGFDRNRDGVGCEQ